MGTKRDVPEWAMNFRIFCIKKGLSTKEVASLIGMSSASVLRYFNGDKRPKTVTCKNIQNALGFDMLKEIYLSDRKEIEGVEYETNESDI